jgi:hypothetical protein
MTSLPAKGRLYAAVETPRELLGFAFSGPFPGVNIVTMGEYYIFSAYMLKEQKKSSMI